MKMTSVLSITTTTPNLRLFSFFRSLLLFLAVLSDVVLSDLTTANNNNNTKLNFHPQLFPLGSYEDQEYKEYCCDQFDRYSIHATHTSRVLGDDCENTGAMAACFCGLLQDHHKAEQQVTTTTTTTTQQQHDGNVFLRSSPQDDNDESSSSSSGKQECILGSAGGFPCSNTDLLSFIPLNRFMNDNQDAEEDANDIWGWSITTSADDEDDDEDEGTVREFALIGLRDGVGMVEITDPTNPIIIGKLGSTLGTSSMWRDIKVYNNHAFVVSETKGHGMQVFDLTRLLTASSNTTTTTTTFTSFDADTTFDEFRAHNLVINEDTGYAYIVGGRMGNRYLCGGGLYMIDIMNPLSPQIVGCGSEGNYTHDAHCVVYHGPDTAYVGKEICFLCNVDHVGIVDVSDKENPVMISETSYRSSQYSHQGWLSPGHSYFVFGDELDETREGIDTTLLVMNVEDLNNPREPGRYVATGRRAIDHNLYIRNFPVGGGSPRSTDMIYFANYRAGLRVMKVIDYAGIDPCTSTPGFEEIAYFDTYPEDDDPGYNGAWSVFPYFESGTVIISSIGEGLFIVRPEISSHLPPTETPNPSSSPSGPTSRPSAAPSCSPTMMPSSRPSFGPSVIPSSVPTVSPSDKPSATPSETPSGKPSGLPTSLPSESKSPTVISDIDPLLLEEVSNPSSSSKLPKPQAVVVVILLLIGLCGILC